MTVRHNTIDPVPLDARFDAPGVLHKFTTVARTIGDNVRAVRIRLLCDATWDAGARRATVALTGNPTGGSLVLSVGGMRTAPIFTPTAAGVQDALWNLGTVGPGNVTCAGGPLTTAPVFCTFSAARFPALTLPELAADGSALVGGNSPRAFFMPAEIDRWGVEVSFDGGGSWQEWFDNRHVPFGWRENDGGYPSQHLDNVSALREVIGAGARLFMVLTYDGTFGAQIDVATVPGELG